MKRLLPFLAIVVLAGAAAAVTILVVIKQEMERSAVLLAPVAVEVLPGQSLRLLAARLREANLIGSERIFLWAAARRGVDRTIKHGLHEFEGEVSLTRILTELTRVPRPVLRVTIPEGLTIREIGALLERAGATDAAAYRAVACSPELRQIVGAPPAATCAEGYLFPDTYDLRPGMSPGAIVDLQIRRFQAVVPPLLASAQEQPDDVDFASSAKTGPRPAPQSPVGGRDLSWILTLASIVEKETGLAAERPRIAAVFYNRLRARMPLQTDPTVIYGVIESGAPWDGNLTRTHLRTPHPYNTYMVKDLPPGPICNPGRAAIEAVLRPDSTKEYYFVARGDGSHEFTANLADHNRAVRRYQLRTSMRGGPTTRATTAPTTSALSQLPPPKQHRPVELRHIFAYGGRAVPLKAEIQRSNAAPRRAPPDAGATSRRPTDGHTNEATEGNSRLHLRQHRRERLRADPRRDRRTL